MSKIISKIYIFALGFLLVLPSGAFALTPATSQYFSATTLSAVSITTSTAKLSGNISFDEGLGSAWFEYGTNSNLDNVTSSAKYVSKYEGALQGVSKSLFALQPNTTYYYRVCLETTVRGLTCGQTKSFKTKSQPVVTTTTTNTNSNSNSNSNSSTSTNTKDDDKKDDKKEEEEENSQTASVASATRDGNFLPNTFLEWILTIILIFFIVMFGRYLYVKRQIEKEEEEKRQKEQLIRTQMA